MKKTLYINNETFLLELKKYKNLCDTVPRNIPKPRIPNYIGECFMKIANNLAKRPNFSQYTYKDEMISDAIENCVMYFENFDHKKSSNPFGYFTKICWYAFVRRIAREKRQQYIKYKATESFCILDEEEMLELDEGALEQLNLYDNNYEFIFDYEETMEKKKTISKKKGFEIFIEESDD